MPIVKSFAIGNGEMYYLMHRSDNFSMIDCSLPDDRAGSILAELSLQSIHWDRKKASGAAEALA